MKTTKDYAKECSVLFVDDEQEIRDMIKNILTRLFKEVYFANSGLEAIESYKKNKPDLIITDINMPKMNGLDMIKNIREDDLEQKIIILSAYNDYSFIETAINYKVDGYLIKPLDMKLLLNSIDNSVRVIVQKKELENLNKHLEKRVLEEIEKNNQKEKELSKTLSSFLEANPNPIVVYEDGVVRFANNEFLALIGKNKEEVIDKNFCIQELFEKRAGFVSTLSEIDNEKQKNKISINIGSTRHVYYVVQSAIPHFNNELKMFTFNDITLIEYQKLKIEHYAQRLEDYIKRINRQRGVAKTSNNDFKIEEEKQREFNEEELSVLKKSHNGKEISSVDYAKELDSYVFEEIQELAEIEDEILNEIAELKESKKVESIYFISERLLKYSSTINVLFEFIDLSFAIKSLAELLARLESNELDDTKIIKIELFLTNIIVDLSNWRRVIFIEKATNDIHYLDSSLFSAILQLEMALDDRDSYSGDSDNLEFF